MSKKYMLDARNIVALIPSVKEVLHTKSILLSIFVCIIGLSIVVLSSWIEDKSSSTYMAGNTLAIILLIIGFYRLLFKRTSLMYMPTKSEMVNGSFYFDTKQLDSLKKTIIEKMDVDYSQYEFVKSGNARLDYVVARDGNFVAVQIYQYVPYTFEPVCEVICFEAENAQRLGQFILDHHGKI